MKKGIGFVSKVRLYKELSLLEELIKDIKSKLDLDASFDSAPILKHLHVSYDTLLIYEIQSNSFIFKISICSNLISIKILKTYPIIIYLDKIFLY